MATFAERLNHLFDTVHPPGRKSHTNAEVAATLTKLGHSISKPYISQLRSGQRDNPSRETVDALARFFKVAPYYFFNDIYAETVDEDFKLISQINGYTLRQLTLKSFDLSEESQQILSRIAEKFRQAEGLPPSNPS